MFLRFHACSCVDYLNAIFRNMTYQTNAERVRTNAGVVSVVHSTVYTISCITIYVVSTCVHIAISFTLTFQQLFLNGGFRS